jgi:zinc protease
MLALVSMIGYYGLPLDYLNNWTDRVEAVSADDIKDAFSRKLATEKFLTVIVGQKQE